MYANPPASVALQIGVKDLARKIVNPTVRSSLTGQFFQFIYRSLLALFTSTHLLDSKISRAVALSTVLNHPRSRGSVTLASADPRSAPIIDLNLLAAPEDMDRLVQGVREQLKCWKSEPIASQIADFDPKTKALFGKKRGKKRGKKKN